GKTDHTLFIKKQKGDILLVQVYIDDIIFGSTNKDLCKAFEKLMKDKFQMSLMGELTFFLGLQVKQKQDGIFISQDKYVAKILRKFGLTDRKSASTPIDTEKPLLKDPDGEDVDVHTYRSMIDYPFNLVAYSNGDYAGASLDRKSTTGGCQFLGCRLISWQCKKQTVVAISSTEAEYVATQFWTSVLIKKTNDVVRLQALIDRKKVIIIKDSIRQALRLDYADSVDCLLNEEIFLELARMRYEKPSTKLTFYKAFFSAQWGEIVKLDANEDVTLETVDADVQGRLKESQAKVYHLDLEHADKVLKVVTNAATTITAAPVPKPSAPRRRRGVIIQDPEEAATASVIMQSENDVVDQVKRKERQDNAVMRYQALKRKPVTEAHARKNMMVYLKNMAGFKIDFFRGMTYTDIRPIFEKHYNSIQAFLDKGEEEIIEQEEGSKRKDVSPEQRAGKKQRIDEEKEKLKRHIHIVVNDDDDVFTKATPLALKVPVDDYQIYYENNKPFYKIIKADGTHKLFLSFITLLKNFDREDLEILLKLVQERFQS
nr:hypothetical protein [Tanacetum cinerariifolium]